MDRDAGVTSNLTADSSNRVETSKKKDVGNGKAKLKSATVKDIISKGRTMTGSRPDEININPVQEAVEKTAVMAFGRFNPITTGHEKLVKKVESTAEKLGGKAHIIASHSQGDARNPLKSEKKVEYLSKVAKPETAVTASTKNAPSLLHHAAKLHAAGYKHLVMVAGEDRVPQYHEILNKYNGIQSKHGHYDFKSIKVVSAGNRDPDAEGTEGMSGTKMRELARSGNHAAFKKGLPKALHPHSKEIMDQIRSVTEEFESLVEQFNTFANESVNLSTKQWVALEEKAADNELSVDDLYIQYRNAYLTYQIAPKDNLTAEQFAFNSVNSYVANIMFEKRGLWANIHAKRERIKRGSGEKMRKPGSEGAPTKADLERSQVKEEVNNLFEKEFKATDREVTTRRTPHGIRTFQFVKRKGDRKNDSEMYRQQALQKNTIDEEDAREYDYEGDMAMSDLRSIMHNAQRIHDLLKPETNLPEWCQSKITLAEDYISTVANYMTAEKGDVKEESGCPLDLLDEDLDSPDLIEEDFLPTGLELYEDWGELSEEATKGGRKVKLGKPFLTPGGPKKRAVYVKNDKGNVVKVNFGDPNMTIKKSDPARRRSFRARHNCDNPGPRHKARYWSCKAW